MTATATFATASSSSTSGLFDRLAQMGHEQLVLCSDPSASYRGIIAVHSTTLGPALGGTRATRTTRRRSSTRCASRGG